MADDESRRALERTLSGLQGRHEALRDLIGDLRSKPELSPGEQRQLLGVESQLAGLESEMADIAERL